jgi:hypothetical protein
MDTEIRRLVAAAGFIFRGKIEHHWKVEAPATPPEAGETVAVRIEHVLRSTPVLRSLAGQEAFVMTREADALRQSRSPILFTECVSFGQQLLLREIGQVEATDAASRQVAEAIRAADERPLRERVMAADLIVVGEVIDSRPGDRPFPPRSEHDPLWSLARVAVSEVLKGRKPRTEIEVLYASSDDHVWFHSPKLHVGVSGILLLFHLNEKEVPRDVPRSAYQTIDPLDFLPHDRRGEVERLLDVKREGRRDV